MKSYTLKLKGTKKHRTHDFTTEVLADNKSQAFAMAFDFFEKGRIDTIYGRPAVGYTTIEDYIPAAITNKVMALAGKYKVYRTSIICNK